MDDRGSGWPGYEHRLAWIEDELARLQADITQLREILPERLKSDPRTPWEIGSSGVSTGEPPVTAGRRGSLEVRFRSDAIGGVEKQLTTLRWEVERLLRLVEISPTARSGGPPRTRTRTSDSAGRSRGDTTPEAPRGATPTGDQADGGTGDDELNRSLDPTKGPGGSGPGHKKTETPAEMEPEKRGFGF